MSDASSFGNAFQGNVSPVLDPPQVQIGPDGDKQAAVLAPKHPHWRNDAATKDRHYGYANQGALHSRMDQLTNTGASGNQSDLGPVLKP